MRVLEYGLASIFSEMLPLKDTYRGKSKGLQSLGDELRCTKSIRGGRHEV